MIAPKEMLDIKQRMLLAGDVAKHLANSEGEFLELEPEQYQTVYEALDCLRMDCRRVLAELDVLRGMFAEKAGLFFMEVVDAGDGQGGHGRVAVESVPDAQHPGCGEGTRDVVAEASGGSDRGRAARKPRKRSKPRRDSKGDSEDQGGVDAGPGACSMDRGTQAQ